MKFQMEENEKLNKTDFINLSKSCKKNADEFYNLALNSMGNQNLISAVFCNFSFSCELYIKALLLNENKNVRGHELTKLFKQISSNVKDEVIERFKSEISEEMFYLKLNESKLAFESLRYKHEFSGMVINGIFLFQLSSILHIVASEYIKQ